MEVKATSNLDPGTESEVEAAQETLLAARTSIVVAHRLRTARRADRVLAMEGGRVVEDGTYENLAGRGMGHSPNSNAPGSPPKPECERLPPSAE